MIWNPISYNNYSFKDYFKEEGKTYYEKFKELYNLVLPEYGEDPETFLLESDLKRLFSLLLRRYGGSEIQTQSYAQWNYRFIGVIYDNAKEWSERCLIQDFIKAQDLDSDELKKGSGVLYSEALNDASSDSHSDPYEVLPYINAQRGTHYTKSKLEAIINKYGLMRSTMNEDFLDKFKGLFSLVLSNQHPTVYITKEN